MFADQFCRLQKILVGSLVLFVLSYNFANAGIIIDLQEHQPIGVISINAAGDQTYFSLGNGRALQISSQKRMRTHGVGTQNLVLKGVEEGAVMRAVSRRQTGHVPGQKTKRNLKW